MAIPTPVYLDDGDNYYLWWQENDGQGYPTEEAGGHIIGAGGDDWIEGDAERDWLEGSTGNDSLFGAIFGGVGEPGADWLLGEAGNDQLYGYGGDDRLEGGR